jgi:hypothetical protein
MDDHAALRENTSPVLRLRVLAEASDRPVAGARVLAKLISTREKPREVFRGETGPDGWVEAVFEIPKLAGNAAVLFQAEAAGNNAELKKLVLRDEA